VAEQMLDGDQISVTSLQQEFLTDSKNMQTSKSRKKSQMVNLAFPIEAKSRGVLVDLNQ